VSGSTPPDPALSEADLVARCADGDRAAWEAFVQRYGALLQVLARRMLARRTGRARDTDVDEVVGEVFLALVRRDRVLLKRYDPQYRVSTYLGVICRTEVLRLLRRGNRLPRELEETGHLVERPGSLGPARALEDRERTEAIESLREALRKLPERDRELLTMKYLDGLDYRGIGAALDLNPESVGQFLHRAKRRLADLVPHLQRWLAETAEHE